MRSPIQNNFKWVLPSASEGLALPESKVKKKGEQYCIVGKKSLKRLSEQTRVRL